MSKEMLEIVKELSKNYSPISKQIKIIYTKNEAFPQAVVSRNN